ncbi:MAG: hypothetical protein J4F41_07320 [Alphaproteobacteria bacterium]|nr:hypothetical protein [Alphaproteobacteria bacterium]
MIDPRFFPEAVALSVKTIEDLVRGEKHRGSASLMARMVATPETAEPGSICFAQTEAAAQAVADEKGVICLAAPQ